MIKLSRNRSWPKTQIHEHKRILNVSLEINLNKLFYKQILHLSKITT